MCTAISVDLGRLFFGRNLDLHCSFGERVAVSPRNHRLDFRMAKHLNTHHAMIGMARVADGYPLYAEAISEKGIAMAGLNFPINAVYADEARDGRDPVSPFEVILWVLGQAENMVAARRLLERICVVNCAFRKDIPLTPLHWMVCDGKESLVLESTAEGVRVYENPVGVLTNNPPFPHQLSHLAPLERLSSTAVCYPSAGRESEGLGYGAYGLPGDFSSPSRFIKAAWLLQRQDAVDGTSEGACVSRTFDLLSSVAPIKGSVLTQEGMPHYTVYACCADLRAGRFYLKAHGDPQVRAVNLFDLDLDGECLQEPKLALAEFER